MTRKEGYIEVNKMLEEIGVDAISISSILDSCKVNKIDYDSTRLHFSFQYHNETYYFKRNIYRNRSPYNELVAEELAKDFGIPCVDYDLATLGIIPINGVISKDFKKSNVNYILGEDILGDTHSYYDSDLEYDLIRDSKWVHNTLDDIWDKLEERYQSYPNKEEIISHLMGKIVNIYLFDIITCQNDRHCENWQIMESTDGIDIAPIYDNERILYDSTMDAFVGLGVDFTCTDYEMLYSSIKRFQKVSSEDFTDIIREKLWIISEENLYKVFDRIEKKTGYPMPEVRKEFYLNGYREHKKRLEEALEIEDMKKR